MKISKYYLLSCLVIILEIFILIRFGQPLISKTGKIMLFWPYASGIENSQQLSDWYSSSHFSHGVIFFFLVGSILTKLGRFKLVKGFIKDGGVRLALLVSVCTEALWEVMENSPIIINRYRLTGLAAGYFGDSVINSVSDTLFMVLGFYFAKKFGWKVSLVTVIFLELLALYFIKDNLLLNIIMLLHPVGAINTWQMS